jgi:hypothetical protein
MPADFLGGVVLAWLLVTLVRVATVLIGWYRLERVVWPRPMRQFHWDRVIFRDVMGGLVLLASAGIAWFGLNESSFSFLSKAGWLLGVYIAWKYPVLPALLLGVLHRYQINPPRAEMNAALGASSPTARDPAPPSTQSSDPFDRM